ncbi:MAG: DUF1307 domain-containing protein [Erysipelotrichaceae bacterium]
MKKIFKALSVCLCAVVLLGGCGASKEAVFNYKAEGTEVKETITYKGDKVEKEVIVSTLTYNKLPEKELKELKTEMDESLKELQGIIGVIATCDVTDTKTVSKIEIDYKNNLESLIDAGYVVGEKEGQRPDYLSYKNVKSNLNKEGFVEVKE